MEPSLIELLRCPETRQKVSGPPPEILKQIMERFAAGEFRRSDGGTVEPFETVLLREDGQVAYPVREGIPVMLIDEAIRL